jgi:hypothetical protein
VFLREEVAEVVVGHRLLLEEEVLVAVGFAVRSWRPRHSCYKHAAERRDVLGGRAGEWVVRGWERNRLFSQCE